MDQFAELDERRQIEINEPLSVLRSVMQIGPLKERKVLPHRSSGPKLASRVHPLSSIQHQTSRI